jgi:hypothetical protein
VRLKQFLIAIDQLANTLAGGFADETLSARCWRERRTTAIRVIDALFFFDPDHCENSWRSEVLRLQLPKGYRQ